MSMFRKKPVVIEAEQLTKERALAYLIEREPLPFGISLGRASWRQHDREVWDFYARVETLEGVMRAELGDWIIRGVKGEVYPCKPDIFEATYEAVEP